MTYTPQPNKAIIHNSKLTRSGKINTAGISVNTAVSPANIAGSKPTVNHPRPISNAYKKGYSQVIRPFNKYSANKNRILNKKVNTTVIGNPTAERVTRKKRLLTEMAKMRLSIRSEKTEWKGLPLPLLA
ncbi:hypothetical protein Tco_0096950 [Tanacetum coccineum]